MSEKTADSIKERPDLIEEMDKASGDAKSALTFPKTNHWASDARKCIRQQWFAWHGIPSTESFDIDGEQIMADGRVIEDNVVQRWRRVKPYVKPQAHVIDLEHRFSGYVDLLVPEDGIDIPVEVKTSKDWGRDGKKCSACGAYVPGDPDAWTKFIPSKSHQGQLQLYMHVLGVPYGYLHYHNRNVGAEKIFQIPALPAITKEIFEEFKTAEQAEMPNKPKGSEPHGFPCGHRDGRHFCRYYGYCWDAVKVPASKREGKIVKLFS